MQRACARSFGRLVRSNTFLTETLSFAIPKLQLATIFSHLRLAKNPSLRSFRSSSSCPHSFSTFRYSVSVVNSLHSFNSLTLTLTSFLIRLAAFFTSTPAQFRFFAPSRVFASRLFLTVIMFSQLVLYWSLRSSRPTPSAVSFANLWPSVLQAAHPPNLATLPALVAAAALRFRTC